MNELKFSILMPVYNMSSTIGDTIKSVLSQSYHNFEIIIQDNNSNDGTERVINSFSDERIKYFKNEKNIGAMLSMVRGKENCSGDIIYLMAADDILGKNALLKTYNAFKISEDIGAVTRPYYWFDKSIETPVRAKNQLNSGKDVVIHIDEKNFKILSTFLSTLDQLSGLAFRKKYMKETIRDDLWTCHGYPFISIWKKHPVVFLKDYTIAVRIGSSATRADIYTESPMMSWIKMFEDVFSEPKFKDIRRECIENFVATNYVGLIQIKNYGKFRSLIREILYLIRYRPKNLINPIFWFFSLSCLVIPSFILIPMTDWYKNKINSKLLDKINFEYDLSNK